MIDLGPVGKPPNPIRLVLADDHVVFRAALRALLERQQGVVVVGEAGRGDEALDRCKVMRPHVVLMDLVMPGEGGLVATRRIVALGIGTKVLVLTALAQEQQLLDALDAGALGFVEKVAPVEDLTRAIRTVARGRLFLGADAAKFVALERYRRAEHIDEDQTPADWLGVRAPCTEPPRARP